MAVSSETFGGVVSIKATPLEKMVLLAMMLETPPGCAKWSFTKQSISIVGCSKRSFHNTLNKLISVGLVRRLKANFYTTKVSPAKAPFNYDYAKLIFPLNLKYKEKFLLLLVSSFIHRSGDICWPSRTRLTKLAGISEKVFKNLFTTLTENGLILVNDMDGKTVLQVPKDVLEVYPVSAKIKITSAILEGLSAKIATKSAKIDNFSEFKTLETFDSRGSQRLRVVPNYFRNYFMNNIEQGQNKFAGGSMIPKAVSAKDMLKSIAEKKNVPKGKPGKVLAGIWRETLPTVCEVCKMNELHITQKQQGQLNMLAKRLGSDPAGKFKRCLLEWLDLVYYIETLAGLKKVPKVPHIGFLLANVLYVNMYFQANDEKGVSAQPVTKLVDEVPKKLVGDDWEKKKAEWAKQVED